MDGFAVMPMIDAAPRGDYFITTTGCCGVIRAEHLADMKDRAILANAGHFDVEIDKKALAALGGSPRKVRRNVEEYRFKDGRRVYLLTAGRLVNLAGAEGHPAEIIDLTFAVQLLCYAYITQNRSLLKPGVIAVPESIDLRAARLFLDSRGIGIDTLTSEQQEYIRSWVI